MIPPTPNRKLRIMQVIGSGSPGGAETFYLRLIRALRAHVDIIPVVKKGSWVAEHLVEMELPFYELKFGGWWDMWTKKELGTLITELKPDIVQAWMNRAASHTPKTTVPVVGRLGGYYDLKYYSTCNWLVGNTEDICTYIRLQGWPSDRVMYVPNFSEVPPADFMGDRLAVRNRYGIPEDAFVVLLAGRLHEAKGFDVALYAMQKLPTNVHLLIAGEGPQRANLQAAAEADGLANRVHFAGWVARMNPLCAAADVWLVPSRHEPLGNVVLDAWMHAIPVIATRTAGPSSLIKDGDTGLLIPPENHKSIVSAVEKLMNDPDLRTQLAANGKRNVDAHFTEAAVVSKYLSLYQQILSSHSLGMVA